MLPREPEVEQVAELLANSSKTPNRKVSPRLWARQDSYRAYSCYGC
jgi:hypothetical protein